MDGVFVRKKTNIWLVLLLLCGIFFVALYVFLQNADPKADSGLLTFLILGILCGFVAIPSMLLNHGAYIHIGENRIKAKYHWFGRLDCSIEDIAFVLPNINTLTILMKTGKRHVIMGVENSQDLATAIRRQSFQLEKESPDSLRSKLSRAQAIRKKELWWVLGGMVLLFVNIFIAVWLTGGREMNEFSKLDWVFFSVMGLIELATLVALFYAAQRCGKHLLPIEQLKYRLRGAVVATQPLPNNQMTAVYTDENYTGRIVICGFPNDESIYYCVQEIVGSFELETVYTSEIYESMDELPEETFSALMDMTSLL